MRFGFSSLIAFGLFFATFMPAADIAKTPATERPFPLGRTPGIFATSWLRSFATRPRWSFEMSKNWKRSFAAAWSIRAMLSS